MSIKHLIPSLILMLIIVSCRAPNKDADENTVKHNSTMDANKIENQLTIASASVKVAVNEEAKKESNVQYKEYQNPKNLKELFNHKLVVDTLFVEKIANGVGDDDNDYKMVFNEIVGIDTSGKNKWGIIWPIDSTAYFNPIHKVKNQYYLPFCMSPACQSATILQWEINGHKLEFVKSYGIQFLIKYGAIKVSDVKIVDDSKYMLIERFVRDESSKYGRRFTILKIDNDDVLVFDSFDDPNKDDGDFESCCTFIVKSQSIEVVHSESKEIFKKIDIGK